MQTASDKPKKPNPFYYQDYRVFLKDWWSWAKTEKKMTQAKFAHLCGLKTHTHVGMILSGKRNLTSETVRSFKRALHLNYSESQYFEALVRLNQAVSMQEQMLALAEVQSVTLNRAAHFVQSVQNEELYLKDWYVPVVRELLKLPALPHNPAQLSKAVGGKITEKQIQESIDILLRLKRIEWQAELGRYVVSGNETFDFRSNGKNLVLRNYHCRILDYTRGAAESQPSDERELSSICIATSQARLALLKQRINEFRREMHHLLQTEPNETTNQVVIFNTQLLQLRQLTNSGESHE